MAKRLIPLLILLAAALARFGVLGEEARFHGDEALFATYARNAAVYGDWMLSGPLDKPPLSLYAMAVSMQFTGVSHLPLVGLSRSKPKMTFLTVFMSSRGIAAGCRDSFCSQSVDSQTGGGGGNRTRDTFFCLSILVTRS